MGVYLSRKASTRVAIKNSSRSNFAIYRQSGRCSTGKQENRYNLSLAGVAGIVPPPGAWGKVEAKTAQVSSEHSKGEGEMKIEWEAISLPGDPNSGAGSIEFHDTWCDIRKGISGQFIEYDTINSLSYSGGHWLRWRCTGCSYTDMCVPETVLEKIYQELLHRVLAAHGK